MSEVAEKPWRPVPVAFMGRNEAVLDLSRDAQLLLYQLFRVCDDAGRFTRATRVLQVTLPWLGRGLEVAMKQLIKSGVVVGYDVGGRSYGYIDGYLDLVKLSWPNRPVYPDPPTVPDTVSDTVPPTVPQTVSDTVPQTVDGREREEREEKKTKTQTKSSSAKPEKSQSHTGERARVSGTVSDTVPLTVPPTVSRTVSVTVPQTVTATVSGTVPPTVRLPSAPLAAPPAPRHPDVERAMDMWLAVLATCSPQTLITRDTLERIADETEEDVFCEAIERHIGDDPRWWRMHQIGALKKRIDWTRQAIDAATKNGEDKVAARAARGGMSSRPVERVDAPSQPPPALSPAPPTAIDPDEDRWMEGKRPGWWPVVEGQMDSYTRRTLAAAISVEDAGRGDVIIYCPDSSTGVLLDEAAGSLIRSAVPGRQVVYR